MIGLIWAQASNRVIGMRSAIPWYLPEDLAHFRSTTLDSTVVMGRRTWESLPDRFRPLPGRHNIVLTRHQDHPIKEVQVATSLDQVLSSSLDDIWIIGGAEVFEQALDRADRIVRTDILESFDGDVLAPRLRSTQWCLADRGPSSGWHTSRTGLRYRFTTWEPRRQLPRLWERGCVVPSLAGH